MFWKYYYSDQRSRLDQLAKQGIHDYVVYLKLYVNSFRRVCAQGITFKGYVFLLLV